MIAFETRGNILNSELQTLVCPVNTMGVMGAGLAKQFKEAFPGLLEAYRKACAADVFKREGFFVYTVSENRKILCLPTKRHWKHPSRLEWIATALGFIAENYTAHDITSLAMPAIGCGLGKLEWESVNSLIHEYLDPIELEVGIYYWP